MNQVFEVSRFRRLFMNDALALAKPAGYAVLALFGLTMVVYLLSFEPGRPTQDPVASLLLFSIFLHGAGLIATSLAYQDMHHPLSRYHYLMLPVSNAERFLSRYLLTGPLFLLLAVVAFSGADALGNAVTYWLRDVREPLFAPLSPRVLLMMKAYLFAHALMITGAICFRSLALVKTILWVNLVAAGGLAVMYLSLRLFFAGSFELTGFHAVESLRLMLLPRFAASWANYAAVILFVLWVLWVACRCLRSHQVQDEL